MTCAAKMPTLAVMVVTAQALSLSGARWWQQCNAGANEILLAPNLCSTGCVKQICDFSPSLGAQEFEPAKLGNTGYIWITLTLPHLELLDVQCWATLSYRMDYKWSLVTYSESETPMHAKEECEGKHMFPQHRITFNTWAAKAASLAVFLLGHHRCQPNAQKNGIPVYETGSVYNIWKFISCILVTKRLCFELAAVSTPPRPHATHSEVWSAGSHPGAPQAVQAPRECCFPGLAPFHLC